MTTATRTSSVFPMGLCFVALILAASVLLPMLAAMPAMIEDSSIPAEQSAAPADMDDAELRLEIERAEVANERYIAANDVAIARGWYSLEYTDAELAGIAAGKLIVMTIPDVAGAVEVNIEHIAEHGEDAVQAVKAGGFKKGDCNGGDKGYAYKLADDGRYWLQVSWQGKIVTCFRATWSYILWCFKNDGCQPPRPPFMHDAMSSPAY